MKVPSLLGMTEEEARKELKDKKIGLGITIAGSEESDKYGEGQIAKQDPAGGETVKKNTTINVIISSGLKTEKVLVPDVSGMSEDAAQKALEEKGLKVGTSDFVYDDSRKAGEVIETTPSAGSEVAEETEIIMKVSKGSEKKTVPNVVGKKDETAQKELIDAGLVVGEVGYEYDDKVAKGKVVSQSIKAGKKVEPGTSIKIVVSNGKKPDEKVKVPNLGNKTYQEAKSLLESYGLVAANGGEEESDEAIGKVCRWSSAGKSVKKGTTITVWISSGPGQPDPVPPDNTGADGQPTVPNDDPEQ